MRKKKMTSEEKIEKAKKHFEELHSLNLTQEELEFISGGVAAGDPYNKLVWDGGGYGFYTQTE